MDLNTPNAREHAWSSYWAGGALHSCVESYGGNYAGAIGGFWSDCFGGLPANGRVLDLATGNGPLPLLLWEQVPAGKNVLVDAVDLAVVCPPWHDPARHARLRFHSGVNMEALPFAGATFDLVMSQFGLEYARWPDALIEAMRVMKPGGRAAFVMHHADSVLARVARSEHANQRVLLADDGLLAAAGRVIPWIPLVRHGTLDAAAMAEATGCRQQYNSAMQRIEEQIRRSPVPDLLVDTRAWVHGLLSGTQPGDAQRQLALLDDYRDAVQAAMLRTEELVAHAMDTAQAEAMCDVFRRHLPGVVIRCQTLGQQEGILGWSVLVTPA